MTAKPFLQRSYRAVATIRQFWAYPQYDVICSGGVVSELFVQAIETIFEGGTIDLKDGIFIRCIFKDCLLLAGDGGFLFVGPIRFLGAVRVRTGRNKSAQGQILSEWHRSGEGSLTFEDI